MKFRNYALFAVVAFIAASVAGCGRLEAYGDKISEGSVVRMKDILLEPGKYNGKTVVLKGKILKECPSGCWFDLKDDGAMMHVDIKPSGLAIPQKVGSEATVQGEVAVDNNMPQLIGKGVEIR
jgi:hypothetical protein